MTGSPGSCNSGSQTRNPKLLQQEAAACGSTSDNGATLSDKLRRMAIKNSYESRGATGGSIEPDTKPEEKATTGSKSIVSTASSTTTKAVSTVNSSPHRYSSSRSKRPAQKTLSSPISSSRARLTSSYAAVGLGPGKVSQPAGPSTQAAHHDVGASAGDDPASHLRVGDGANFQSSTAQQKVDASTSTDAVTDSATLSTSISAIPAHLQLRRSSSHSSVAVNSTAPSSSLSQPGAGMAETSSYIYHVPGRMISRGRSRSQSRVHAHMHTHNIAPTLSLKRSSSHSTVALHGTNHRCPIPPPSTASHTIPSSANAPLAVTSHLDFTDIVGSEPLYGSYLHPDHRYDHGSEMYGPSYLSQDVHYGPVDTQNAYGARQNKVYERQALDVGLMIMGPQTPRSFKHTEHTSPSGSSRRRNKLDRSSSGGGSSQPDSLHYSTSSPPSAVVSYRHSRKKHHHHHPPSPHPLSLVELDGGVGPMPVTSFGNSSNFQCSLPGIVPHLVTPHTSSHPHNRHNRGTPPPECSLRIGKRVTLHPPRGNKVASLV